MAGDEQSRVLRELLSLALQDGMAAPGPHVAGEDELLVRWQDGLLDAAERDAVLAHLAVCPECRRDIAAMVQADALRIPSSEAAPGSVSPAGMPAPPTVNHTRRRIAGILTALAATIALAVALWPEPAPDEVALARVDPLDEFVELFSNATAKGAGGGPAIDIEAAARMDQLRQAVDANSADVTARLELGQLLLERRKLAAADEQFLAVQSSGERAALAELGLGLVAFHRAGPATPESYAAALAHFQAVLALEADNVNALVYGALAAEALGRDQLARDLWRRAGAATQDETLRQRIEQRLELGDEGPAP